MSRIDKITTSTKIGKQRNLFKLLRLIVLTVGFYGIIWFGVTLNELRKYRGKGIPGWVLLIPIIISFILPFLFFRNTSSNQYFDLLIPLVWFITLFIIAIHFFLIPYYIDMEIVKLGLPKKKLVYNGFIPLFADSTLFITSTFNIILIHQFILLMILISLNLWWVYIVQINLNELWKTEKKTPSFAIPIYRDPSPQPISNDDFIDNKSQGTFNSKFRGRTWINPVDNNLSYEMDNETEEENLDDSEDK